MTYAGQRRCNDADSHIMELPDWLASFMSTELRDGIGRMSADQVVEITRQMDVAASLEDDEFTPETLLRRKGWAAPGD